MKSSRICFYMSCLFSYLHLSCIWCAGECFQVFCAVVRRWMCSTGEKSAADSQPKLGALSLRRKFAGGLHILWGDEHMLVLLCPCWGLFKWNMWNVGSDMRNKCTYTLDFCWNSSCWRDGGWEDFCLWATWYLYWRDYVTFPHRSWWLQLQITTCKMSSPGEQLPTERRSVYRVPNKAYRVTAVIKLHACPHLTSTHLSRSSFKAHVDLRSALCLHNWWRLKLHDVCDVNVHEQECLGLTSEGVYIQVNHVEPVVSGVFGHWRVEQECLEAFLMSTVWVFLNGESEFELCDGSDVNELNVISLSPVVWISPVRVDNLIKGSLCCWWHALYPLITSNQSFTEL